MFSSAPLNMNTTQCKCEDVSRDMTRSTSSMMLQLTVSSLAPVHTQVVSGYFHDYKRFIEKKTVCSSFSTIFRTMVSMAWKQCVCMCVTVGCGMIQKLTKSGVRSMLR